MSTTFLECNGEAYFTMRLVVKNQGENGVEESIIPIDSSKSYKIVVFDQSKGLQDLLWRTSPMLDLL